MPCTVCWGSLVVVLTSVCAQQFTGVLNNVQFYISTICIVNFEGIINKYSDNKWMFFSHLNNLNKLKNVKNIVTHCQLDILFSDSCSSHTLESPRLSECADLIGWVAGNDLQRMRSVSVAGWAHWAVNAGKAAPVEIETFRQHVIILNIVSVTGAGPYRTTSGSGPGPRSAYQ